MESIEKTISNFISVGYGSGYGYGSGSGYDSGYGYGDGDGYGDGSGSGSGYGYGDGDGSGSGSVDGYGYGSGSVDVSGYGDGSGSGSVDVSGSGSGYGYGIEEYERQKVYIVDGVQTIIQSIHQNIARGFIVRIDMTLEDCFIAKVGDSFAHGTTIHEAVADAQRKHLNSMSEEERIAAFIEKFPTLDTSAPAKELYEWHNILTGSCKMGRDIFCHDHAINMESNYTVLEFIELTKDAYGGGIIEQLKKTYDSYGKR